jgi:uncharacterized protein YndB with AHSA1/START domain
MTTISANIIIARPIEEEFAFLTDARNNGHWQSTAGMVSVRQMPEDTVGVGTRITEILRFFGRTCTATSEVIAFEPNRTYTRHLIAGSSPISQHTFVFAPVAGGTEWTFAAEIHSRGIFAPVEWLLTALLRPRIEAGMAEAQAALEQRVTEHAR